MNAGTEITIGILILIGAFLSLISAIGVLRLPDVYTRNHAASKSTTLGVLVTLLAGLIFFFAQDGKIDSRILLGIFFIFLTSPVSGHLLSRAAYFTGVKLSNRSVRDDLSKIKVKDK